MHYDMLQEITLISCVSEHSSDAHLEKCTGLVVFKQSSIQTWRSRLFV